MKKQKEKEKPSVAAAIGIIDNKTWYRTLTNVSIQNTTCHKLKH